VLAANGSIHGGALVKRILYLDVDVTYCNPTRTLLRRLVSQVSDEVCFFGPGYVSSDTLALGLPAFIANHGPFDIVFATEHIAFSEDYIGPDVGEVFRRNYAFRFPLVDLKRCREILGDFQKLPVLKVVSLLESDYYNFRVEHIDRLKVTADFLVGWDENFVRQKSQVVNLSSEAFAPRVNDNWVEFVCSHRERMIPLVHFVSDDEFDYTALAHRPADWCVPGTAYDARRRARTALVKAGAIFSRGKSFPFAAILTRFGLRPFSRPWFISHYQSSFREEIRGARFAFTCGSRLGFPIRKFFEIPALGSVLICAPCNGFDALGFRDGENAFVCEPEALPALGRRLTADLDAVQNVANAGRDLVGKCHTLAARAAQLKMALELALAGRWYGAEWRNGEMIPLPENVSVRKNNGNRA